MGKFDCSFDEGVLESVMESGDGEGDVESPSAWFAEVTLTEAEESFITHYGTRHLLVRELSSGFVFVEPYATQEMLDERLGALRDELEKWEQPWDL